MVRFSKALMILPVIALVFTSCSKKVTQGTGTSTIKSKQETMALAPCIIYKTNADYSANVPIILSKDKTTVVSYPDKKDLYYQGKPAYPTALDNGFLLDNRGIGPDVAFLSLTYDAYQLLEKTPSAEELMKLILDNDPLKEMYQCGNRSQYADPVTELNAIIASGKISDCKKLK
jgi:hypothetical protein